MKLVVYAFLTAALASSNVFASTNTNCDALLAEVASIGGYKGVSAKLTERIDKAADSLVHTENAYNQIVEGQEMILNTHILTMATGQNHLLLGPPGAAKTMGVDFLFNYSEDGIWSKQVNEWTTPFEIYGGQTEEGMKEGREIINTKGFALEAKYVLLDELNNANPQLLGSLLSYLNPGERRVPISGINYKGITRSVFSTGNATRAEILATFSARKLQSGPAMLNRYAFKSFVYNWRQDAQQARLDDVYERIEKLKSVIKYGSAEDKAEAKKQIAQVTAQPIDVELVESLATHAFVASDLLKSTLREYVNALRVKMNNEKLKTKMEHAQDPQIAVFEPSTEWTERVRASFMKLIRTSAALDLLRLDKKTRDALLKKPIELTPMSMWRIVNMAITNTEGIAFFDIPEGKMQFNLIKDYINDGKDIALMPIDIDRMKTEASDPREVQQWTEIELEQTSFNDYLKERLDITNDNNKAIAALLNPDGDVDLELESSDFEFVVYARRWAKIAKTLKTNQKKAAATPAPATETEN